MTRPSPAPSTILDATDRHGHRDPSAFADAIRFSLQLNPKQLPSRFLYDALGSALFDAICHLPWYRIPQAELRLLQRHAVAIAQVFREGGASRRTGMRQRREARDAPEARRRS